LFNLSGEVMLYIQSLEFKTAVATRILVLVRKMRFIERIFDEADLYANGIVEGFMVLDTTQLMNDWYKAEQEYTQLMSML
tara:strand:+ start:2754 stop:2993 length:240 start_codon:yes stop_codon:yes gene_type:complete